MKRDKKKLEKKFLKNDLTISVNLDGLKNILMSFLMFQQEMAISKVNFNSTDEILDIFLNDLLNKYMHLTKT